MNSSDDNTQKSNDRFFGFLSNLTHEINTPVGNIKAYSELLLAEKFGSLTEDQQESIQRIHNYANIIGDCLWSYIWFAQIESSVLNKEQHAIDLISVLNEIVQKMQSNLDTDNQTIQFDIPEVIPDVNALRSALYEILFQLIENIQSCSASGEQILISVNSEEKAVKTIISTESFSPDKSKRAYLLHSGFKIIKHSIEQFGGKFCDAREEGKGGEVWFTLPIADELTEQE